MIVVARLVDPRGAPLSGVEFALLAARAEGPAELGRTESDGEGGVRLAVEDATAVALGARVAGRPVLVLPQSVSAKAVDLGTLTVSLDAALFESQAFPCEGACHGLPQALHRALSPVDPRLVRYAPEVEPVSLSEQPPDRSPARPPEGAETATPQTPAALPPRDATSLRGEGQALYDVVKNTADQLSDATRSLDKADSAFELGEVHITMKGVLVGGKDEASDVAIVLDDAGVDPGKYSEIDYVLNPRGDDPPPPPPPPKANDRPMPDLRGYTRSLAERKLRALRVQPVFSTIAIDPQGPSGRNVGRVVRQEPGAGKPLEAGAPVRLFLGKANRSL